MEHTDPKYPGCWMCDNLVDYPYEIGLLHLGFPRCFVLVRSFADYASCNYEEFRNNISEINWLDPSDKGTAVEQENVIRTLWNFSIDNEQEEEQICASLDSDDLE